MILTTALWWLITVSTTLSLSEHSVHVYGPYDSSRECAADIIDVIEDQEKYRKDELAAGRQPRKTFMPICIDTKQQFKHQSLLVALNLQTENIDVLIRDIDYSACLVTKSSPKVRLALTLRLIETGERLLLSCPIIVPTPKYRSMRKTWEQKTPEEKQEMQAYIGYLIDKASESMITLCIIDPEFMKEAAKGFCEKNADKVAEMRKQLKSQR